MTRILNVKEGNNSFEYAIYLLDCEIEEAKILHDRVIILIHGYGSHGTGGVIKDNLREYLIEAKRHKKIKNFVKGEEWSHQNPTVAQACAENPELILHEQLQGFNSGVTVVII